MRASPAEYKSARPYAHAGASSRVQLGAPPQPGFAAEGGISCLEIERWGADFYLAGLGVCVSG